MRAGALPASRSGSSETPRTLSALPQGLRQRLPQHRVRASFRPLRKMAQARVRVESMVTHYIKPYIYRNVAIAPRLTREDSSVPAPAAAPTVLDSTPHTLPPARRGPLCRGGRRADAAGGASGQGRLLRRLHTRGRGPQLGRHRRQRAPRHRGLRSDAHRPAGRRNSARDRSRSRRTHGGLSHLVVAHRRLRPQAKAVDRAPGAYLPPARPKLLRQHGRSLARQHQPGR